MTLHIVVDPPGSKFAKALQGALRTITNEKVFRRATKKINANNFEVTVNVLDKIQQFQCFSRDGVSCPTWTVDPAEIPNLGSKTVFARTLINSTNGRGIVEFTPGQGETPRAPLYTAYIPKIAEYRLHVFDGVVIDIQQKRKKEDQGDGSSRVRNLTNGYVFCRENIEAPEGIKELAIKAVAAVSYQYGAVDIIYNQKLNKCFVLEVNSRPGMERTTPLNYAKAIASLYNLTLK